MKLICLKPFNNEVFYRNNIFNIDNGHNIFFEFDKKLQKREVLIRTIDICNDSDVNIYTDVPYPWSLKQWLNLFINSNQNILFCFESPLVNPFNHMKLLKIFFKKIYTWDDNKVDNKYYFKFYIPQLNFRGNIQKMNFKDKKFLTMVNAKKSSLSIFRFLSPYKADLYKERLDIINYLEGVIPNEFDLYGWGWKKADPFKPVENIVGYKDYKVYKGEIENRAKVKVMSHYKFAFAVENAKAPGYITEKLFDCFKAGCVPIYYGASNVEKFVPQNCFIDMRDYKNYDDLLEYIKSIDEKKYEKYVKAAREFLSKKKILDTWFEKGFEKVFLDCINIR